MKNCRMAETERGSFVATISTPVPPEIQKVMEFGDAGARLDMEPTLVALRLDDVQPGSRLRSIRQESLGRFWTEWIEA